MNDNINHPAHYTSHPAKCECGKQIECIQVTEHMGFNLGNAMKYLWRAGLKGDALTDLKKAAWYIHREMSIINNDAGEKPHAIFAKTKTKTEITEMLERSSVK